MKEQKEKEKQNPNTELHDMHSHIQQLEILIDILTESERICKNKIDHLRSTLSKQNNLIVDLNKELEEEHRKLVKANDLRKKIEQKNSELSTLKKALSIMALLNFLMTLAAVLLAALFWVCFFDIDGSTSTGSESTYDSSQTETKPTDKDFDAFEKNLTWTVSDYEEYGNYDNDYDPGFAAYCAAENSYEYEYETEVTEDIVWVDSTSERYHNSDGCNMDNAYPVTLSEAEDMGRTPCGNCYR